MGGFHSIFHNFLGMFPLFDSDFGNSLSFRSAGGLADCELFVLPRVRITNPRYETQNKNLAQEKHGWNNKGLGATFGLT